MCDYPFFIPQVVLFANSSLFWFKVTNEHREFRNYLSILNTVYYLFCAFIHITIFTLRLQLIFSDEFFISFRILVYSLTASVRSANEQTFSFFEYTLRSQQPFPPETGIQMCQSGTKAMPIPPCLSQRFRQKVS